MKRLGILLSLAVSCALSAQEVESPVDLTLIVLESGKPLPGVDLVVDGEVYGTTGDGGAVFAKFDPGRREITLRRADNTLTTVSLETVAAETMQIIAVVDEPGADPRLDIESSNQANQGALGGAGGQGVASGPPGTLRGRVVSTETGEPVGNARVFVSGTGGDIRTDAEGNYEVELPPGTYAVSVIHSDHSTQTLDEIQIASERATDLEVELTPAALELPDYVVLEPYIEGSIASVIEERRNSAAVTDILGAEQISKTGDSDAAGALRRVTGLTLVDGKFIYVRGMGERYSTTLINGAIVPSPDPTRRVVPLDLFPTGVIGNLAVQKSFSATMPGEFGGGTVDIRTRGIPDARVFDVGLTIEYESETTGKDGLTYAGGSDDWTGFDDGTREFPESMRIALADIKLCEESRFRPQCFSDEEIEVFGDALAGGWNLAEQSSDPNGSLDLTYGDRFELAGFDLGFTSALSYGQEYDTSQEVRREFAATGPRDDIELNLLTDFDVLRTVRTVDTSAFVTAEVAREELHKILFTSLYVRLTTDEARLDEGVITGVGLDDTIRRGEREWIENDLFTNQIGGEHIFPVLADLKLNWQFTNSKAVRYSPNTRAFRLDDFGNTGNFQLTRRADDNDITFANLADNAEHLQLGLTLPWEFFGGRVNGQIAIGASEFERARDSSIRRFTYEVPRTFPLGDEDLDALFSPENIRPGGLALDERTLRSDFYTADQTLDSEYLELDATFFDTIRLTAGLRREDNVQTVINASPIEINPVVETAEIVTSDSLPALALTWLVSDRQQIRLTYAETLARPDFRELSSAPFSDPVTDAIVNGNPDLQPTAIDNIDLRWEYYFSPGESISVAYFEKDFINPIEAVVVAGESLRLGLQNAQAANNRGVEFEVRKELGFLNDRLANFYVAANAALIESEIQLDPEQALSVTNTNRPLQGQSEYIANFQLGYENLDRDTSATLVFNTAGERISQVGITGLPDVYEQPFNQLDFILSQGFRDRWTFKLRAKNLLDESVEFTQGDEIVREYKKGIELSLGFDYSF